MNVRWMPTGLGFIVLLMFGCTSGSLQPPSQTSSADESLSESQNRESNRRDVFGTSGGDKEQGDSVRKDTEQLSDSDISAEAGSGPANNKMIGREEESNYPWKGYPQSAESSWLTNPPVCRPKDWLGKYFKYRLRFRGDETGRYPGFIDIGNNPGQSLPAGGRKPTKECSHSVGGNDCEVSGHDNAKGFVNWGDATLHLGYYFAVLATEYKVFETLDVDTSQTLKDLYFAIEALKRLDRKAEKLFNKTPEIDGFFLRKDIPVGFEKKENGEFRFPRNGEYDGYACVDGAKYCGEKTMADGDFTSQDQLMALLFGLAFIKKYIPKDATVKGLPLRHEAKRLTHRMVQPLAENGWKFIGPNGNDVPKRWGGSAVGFSNQIAKAANWIVGDEFGVDDYRNTKSRTVGATTFAGLDLSWFMQYTRNRGMALEILSASGEGWRIEKLTRRASSLGMYVYPFARALLHDQKVPRDIVAHWKVESTLTTAPCSGPCHRTPGCDEVPGWMGGNRFRAPNNRFGYRHGPQQQNSGLDYMLMHNLYFLYHNGNYRYATDREYPPKDCGDFKGLSYFISGEASEGDKYRTFDKCGKVDISREFCGRPWSNWLKAAYEGDATIWTDGFKWKCDGEESCTLREDGSKGTAGNDLMLGTSGDDEFRGKSGDDCMYGFGGNDELSGNQGKDEIHGGEGDDKIYGETSGLVLDGDSDFLYGGPGDDTIEASGGYDLVVGNGGDDQIELGNGRDLAEGNEGDDYIKGDAGNDQLNGGAGDDYLKGDGGADHLWGEDGNDKLKGDSGNDRLHDHLGGKDFLKGDSGNDALFSGPGADRLCGDGGSDELWAGWQGGTKDECRAGSDMGEDLGITEEETHFCNKKVGYSACTTSTFEDY